MPSRSSRGSTTRWCSTSSATTGRALKERSRDLQRAHHAERDRAQRRAAAFVDRRVWRSRRLGHGCVSSALLLSVGLGRQHPVPVGEAMRLPPGRHTQRNGRRLARPRSRCGRTPDPVHPMPSTLGPQSWRPLVSPSRPWSTEPPRSPWKGPASSTRSWTVPFHRTTRSSTSVPWVTGPSTKDGWWAACKLDRIPWDLSPGTMARFAPRGLRPRAGHLGALLPSRRLLAGERPRRCPTPKARRAQGLVLGGG